MLILDDVVTPRPAKGAAFCEACRKLAKLADAQRRMLPQAAPQGPDYEIALAYRPARAETVARLGQGRNSVLATLVKPITS